MVEENPKRNLQVIIAVCLIGIFALGCLSVYYQGDADACKKQLAEKHLYDGLYLSPSQNLALMEGRNPNLSEEQRTKLTRNIMGDKK